MNIKYSQTIVRIFVLSVLMAVFTVLIQPMIEARYGEMGLNEYILMFLAVAVLSYILVWFLVRDPQIVVMQGAQPQQMVVIHDI